ncbi:MAG: hypothetical protein ACT4P2_05065 [Pseudomonadota bacterium]
MLELSAHVSADVCRPAVAVRPYRRVRSQRRIYRGALPRHDFFVALPRRFDSRASVFFNTRGVPKGRMEESVLMPIFTDAETFAHSDFSPYQNIRREGVAF